MWLCNIRTFAELFIEELEFNDIPANIDDIKIKSLEPLTLSFDCSECYCLFVEQANNMTQLEINYKD